MQKSDSNNNNKDNNNNIINKRQNVQTIEHGQTDG